jgi:ATPase subunit of ABC transporter with duplicated ATPase domains
MSQGMDQTAYGRYRDQVGDWQTNVGRLQGDYTSERGFDLDMYRNAVSDWQNQQSYDFNVSQFEYQKQQDAQARADALAAAASKGSGRSSGKSAMEKLFEQMYEEEQKRDEEERKKKTLNPVYAPFGTING